MALLMEIACQINSKSYKALGNLCNLNSLHRSPVTTKLLLHLSY